MNTDDEFYLTLLSNSSMGYYQNNTTAQFTTQLPKRIRLPGQWVTGIAEVQYPCSFLPVTESENLVYFRTEIPQAQSADEMYSGVRKILEDANVYFRSDQEQFYYKYNDWHVISIQHGNYESIDQIINEFNTHTLLKKLLNFKYNGVTKRVSLKLKNTTLKVLGFSQRLALQLGYKPDINMAENPVPSHPANIWSGLPSQMFIYCDIVEPQLVGDAIAPLLRIVNVAADNYNYGCHKIAIFSPTHYINVMKREFENIEVNIRTETGDVMPFEFGTLSLKLHFKRIK